MSLFSRPRTLHSMLAHLQDEIHLSFNRRFSKVQAKVLIHISQPISLPYIHAFSFRMQKDQIRHLKSEHYNTTSLQLFNFETLHLSLGFFLPNILLLLSQCCCYSIFDLDVLDSRNVAKMSLFLGQSPESFL